MGKRFLGLDGLKHLWSKAKTWILEQITTEVTSKIAEVVANAPEDFNTLKEIADWISTHADDASAMNTKIVQNQNDIKALKSLVDQVAGYVPVGTIMQGLYATAPTGFLLCDGQEVSIASFPELYAVIGTLAECQSENEGMFKVPDFRECVPVGIGTRSSGVSNHDIYTLGQFKDDQFQGHEHGFKVPNNYLVVPYETGASISDNWLEVNLGIAKKTVGIVSDKTNGTPRIGSTTHGKQIGVNYIIKY